MTDPIEPTPGKEGGDPTPDPKAAKKVEFTQEELDEKFKAREARGEAAAAKRFEKQIKDLTDQIEEFKGKDLGELDKLKGKVEKLTESLKAKDAELTGTNLKLAKIEALLSAGAKSEKIPKLLKRVSGTTPEEIESDVQELVEEGWIVKDAPPDPAKPAANGAGKPPVKDGGLKKFTKAQLKDKAFYEANRDDILKAMEAGLIT